jgi:hypothetical protein
MHPSIHSFPGKVRFQDNGSTEVVATERIALQDNSLPVGARVGVFAADDEALVDESRVRDGTVVRTVSDDMVEVLYDDDRTSEVVATRRLALLEEAISIDEVLHSAANIIQKHVRGQLAKKKTGRYSPIHPAQRRQAVRWWWLWLWLWWWWWWWWWYGGLRVRDGCE